MINVLLDMGKLKSPHSGLGQFSYYFGKYLAQVKDEHLRWNFLVPKSVSGIFGEHHGYETISLKRRILPSLCPKYHLWHALHQDSSFLPSGRKDLYILTVHDLNFLEEKSPAKAKKRLKTLQKKVDRAAAVTFVSNYTAKISNQNLNLQGKSTYVIHNGVSIDVDKTVTKPSYVSSGKYLLALGMVLKKKNFHVLIGLMEKLPDYHLIIAGDNSSQYAKGIMEELHRKHLEKRVILPGTIPETDKIYLYRHCSAFVFPSLLEGFGMPVIEAMKFGKPVFTSLHSSLPEIGGEVAFYWSSFNADHMAERFRSGMKRFEKDTSMMRKKIMEHADRFTWDSCIHKYHTMYQEVTERHFRA